MPLAKNYQNQPMFYRESGTFFIEAWFRSFAHFPFYTLISFGHLSVQ